VFAGAPGVMKGVRMKRLWLLAGIGILSVAVSGCAPLLVGAAVGGAGVYAAGKDTTEGEIGRPYTDVWAAAVRVAGIMGTVTRQDVSSGVLELKTAESSKVWIRVMHLTRETSRLRVAARKYKLPHLVLAQDVYGKIANEAK